MPVLLTIAEVAQRMGISKSGVYRRIAGGDLRAIRISDRAMRVLESDLQAYVDPVGPELTVREAATVLRLQRHAQWRTVLQAAEDHAGGLRGMPAWLCAEALASAAGRLVR